MIDYIKIDGMLYPQIVPNYNQTEFGKYGRMRFEFLKEYNEELLFRLMIQNELIDINERAHQMIKTFEKAYLKDGNEDFKTRLSARAMAEEIVLTELVYA